MITNYADAFSAAWPAVAARLGPRLRRRGVPSAAVEDVLQETAIVALRTCVPFDDVDGLLAWSTVVSRRLAIADYRKRRRLMAGIELDESDRDLGASPEQEALARLDLARVVDAARRLPPEERAAIGASVPPGVDRREAVRLNVRRHRARQKLLLLSGGLGLAGAVLGVLRRLRALAPVTAPVLATLVVASAMSLFGPFGDRDRTERGVTVEVRVSERPSAAPPSLVPRTMAPLLVSLDTAELARPIRPLVAVTPPGADERAEIAIQPPLADTAVAGAKPKDVAEPELCVQMGSPDGVCIDVAVPETPLDEISIFEQF